MREQRLLLGYGSQRRPHRRHRRRRLHPASCCQCRSQRPRRLVAPSPVRTDGPSPQNAPGDNDDLAVKVNQLSRPQFSGSAEARLSTLTISLPSFLRRSDDLEPRPTSADRERRARAVASSSLTSVKGSRKRSALRSGVLFWPRRPAANPQAVQPGSQAHVARSSPSAGSRIPM